MTRYVNMHGSNRLTLKEANALQVVIDMGLSSAVDYVHDGAMTEVEYSRAERAAKKLYACLYDTEKKLGEET